MNEHPVWDALKWVAVGLVAGLLVMLVYRLASPPEPEDDIHGNIVVSR